MWTRPAGADKQKTTDVMSISCKEHKTHIYKLDDTHDGPILIFNLKFSVKQFNDKKFMILNNIFRKPL
jgi:hypothetical protein